MGEFVDIQAPIGADPENDDVRLYNGTGQALVEGDCVMFDETKTGPDGSAAASSTNQSLGIVTAVRLPVTGDITTAGAVACWALESIPIGGVGRFRVSGTCKVKLAADLAANTVRQLTVANGVTTMAASAASGNKVFAKALVGQNAVTVAQSPLCNAWVSGKTGFGGTQ